MSYSKKAQLHCHSGFKPVKLPYMPIIKDSYAKLESILKIAIKHNIKILSLTEHDHMDSFFVLQELIEKMSADILLIPGVELSSKKGHILAYGLKTLVPKGLSVENTLDRIHEQGGIAVAPHPYGPYKGVKNLIYTHPFDALEVSFGILPKNLNKKTIKASKKIGIPYTRSNDAHSARGITKNIMYFYDTVTTVEEVLQSIKSGDFRFVL